MEVHVLLISGSTRAGSTNTAALRTVSALAPGTATTHLYDGLLDLPAFIPDSGTSNLDPAVVNLRRQLTDADAVLFCVPEYAGTLPGSVKNLLDWTVGSGEFNDKPVGWLNVANPGRGGGAIATLASVLRYLDAIVIGPACVEIPVSRTMVNDEGVVDDDSTRTVLGAALTALVGAVGTVGTVASTKAETVAATRQPRG